MSEYTLKSLAEMGYILGLSDIGEVTMHMSMHHYAYFITDKLAEQWAALEAVVDGHVDDSIDLHLTAEDKARLDAELAEAMK